MEPKQHKTRTVVAGKPLQVADVSDDGHDVDFDTFFEDGDMGFVENDNAMPEQERRIESIKRAIDIAKLMSNVSVDDVITIAETVDTYIKEFEV